MSDHSIIDNCLTDFPQKRNTEHKQFTPLMGMITYFSVKNIRKMDSTDSGMVKIEIDGLILTVDKETALILQTDPEARKNYSTQIRQQLFEREQKTVIDIPIWKTSKNQTDRDREATRFFLGLRKKFDKEFTDKTTNKNSIWAQISKIMNDNGFFVGDGIEGREKCRQKFSNLQATYIKYVDKRKQTGQGKIVKPPFYDELEHIMGDKHKIES